jgi:hypothetical protein
MSRMRNGPLEIALLVLIALAGCRGEQQGNGGPGPAASGAAGSAKAVQTATLTGLYESATAPRRNQMCMIEREGRAGTFGFVIWGPGEKSCSGSGPATREGNVLRLRLDGDESCVLDARVEGTRITLPTDIPSDCERYYCGVGVQMGGVTFDKVAGEQADALRATDLVGDPLCGG